MSKTRVYEIHQTMRVSNSPYMLENTNIKYDITPEFTLPNSVTALIDGEPVELRFIARAKSIFKRQQIKEGWAEVYRATDADKKFLTFENGRLEIPEEQQNAWKFLEASPWFDEYSHARMTGTRIIYKRVDTGKDAEKRLKDIDLVLDAKLVVRKLEPEAAKDLLRLSKPNRILSPQLTISDIKLQLNDLAENDPEFIINGVKSNEDKLAVTLSKAVNLNIINLDTIGKVSLYEKGELKPLFNIAETGGRERKFDKTLSWLQGEEGKAYITTIEERITLAEGELAAGVKEKRKAEKDPNDMTKWTKPQLQEKYKELLGEDAEESATRPELLEAIRTELGKSDDGTEK